MYRNVLLAHNVDPIEIDSFITYHVNGSLVYWNIIGNVWAETLRDCSLLIAFNEEQLQARVMEASINLEERLEYFESLTNSICQVRYKKLLLNSKIKKSLVLYTSKTSKRIDP